MLYRYRLPGPNHKEISIRRIEQYIAPTIFVTLGATSFLKKRVLSSIGPMLAPAETTALRARLRKSWHFKVPNIAIAEYQRPPTVFSNRWRWMSIFLTLTILSYAKKSFGRRSGVGKRQIIRSSWPLAITSSPFSRN